MPHAPARRRGSSPPSALPVSMPLPCAQREEPLGAGGWRLLALESNSGESPRPPLAVGCSCCEPPRLLHSPRDHGMAGYAGHGVAMREDLPPLTCCQLIHGWAGIEVRKVEPPMTTIALTVALLAGIILVARQPPTRSRNPTRSPWSARPSHTPLTTAAFGRSKGLS